MWGRDAEEYPAKEQLRTHFAFWHAAARFQLDLVRDTAISDGWALRAPAFDRVVAYKETTASLDLDLSAAPQLLVAVAVDTLANYSEIDLGLLSPGPHTLALPYSSDWAVVAMIPPSVAMPALPPAALVLIGVVAAAMGAVMVRRREI